MWCNAPSNFRCEGNINDFLTEHNIIGIHNIDTRRLTRIIREVGVMNGVITTEDVYAKKDELLEKIRAFEVKNAVKSVTNTETLTYSDEDPKFRVVLFDFGYKRNIRKELVKRGFYLSFTGAVTFKSARRALETIAWMPMERIMIETDSPYLTPVPFRGRRNDSSYVRLVAEKIAEVRGMRVEDVAAATMENGKRFFGIAQRN